MLIERRDPTSLVLRVSIPQKIALPSSWIDSTSSESGELWTKERSQQATLNPCDARNRAVASPKPEEAPVTSATLAMRCIEKNTRSTSFGLTRNSETKSHMGILAEVSVLAVPLSVVPTHLLRRVGDRHLLLLVHGGAKYRNDLLRLVELLRVLGFLRDGVALSASDPRRRGGSRL